MRTRARHLNRQWLPSKPLIGPRPVGPVFWSPEGRPRDADEPDEPAAPRPRHARGTAGPRARPRAQAARAGAAGRGAAPPARRDREGLPRCRAVPHAAAGPRRRQRTRLRHVHRCRGRNRPRLCVEQLEFDEPGQPPLDAGDVAGPGPARGLGPRAGRADRLVRGLPGRPCRVHRRRLQAVRPLAVLQRRRQRRLEHARRHRYRRRPRGGGIPHLPRAQGGL